MIVKVAAINLRVAVFDLENVTDEDASMVVSLSWNQKIDHEAGKVRAGGMAFRSLFPRPPPALRECAFTTLRMLLKTAGRSPGL